MARHPGARSRPRRRTPPLRSRTTTAASERDMRAGRRWITTGLAAVLVASALTAVVAVPGAGAVNSKTCPLNALKTAKGKPVEITMWHSMTRANQDTLQKLVDQFNGSQSDVKVNLVNQIDYV